MIETEEEHWQLRNEGLLSKDDFVESCEDPVKE